MANNKKFVVKNGLTTSNIEFKDDINNGTNTITMSMLSTDVLSFSGDSGQLFSISDSLTGTIFSVNDISGIPSLEVDDDGTIRLAEFAGNILVGSNTDNGSDKLQVTGNTSVNGTIKATDFTIGTSGKLTSNNYVQTYVASEIAGLVDSAPTTLDTLNELAAALGDDANFSTTVTNSLATKASNNYLQSQLSTKLNSSSYTASDVLTKIKTVDGSGSGLDADLLDGAQPSVSASNDTIVKRHSSGYIYANYFNTSPNDVTSGVTKVLVETGNDGFMRHGTQAAIRTFIGAGSGNGLDADLLDGQQGSYYLNTSTSFGGDVSGTYNNIVVSNDSHNHSSSSGNFTVGGDLIVSGGQVGVSTVSTRHKYSVYGSSSQYAIGMQSGITFGGLADWGMTFQFNNDNDRGFWWGDESHSTAQGAMALTTNGKLTVAHSTRIGYGETDTTIPGATHRVDVNGSVNATTYHGDGSNLTGISAGATGGGSDKIFYNNDQTVTTSYTIPSGQNSMTAGPIIINSGVTVTIPSGSEWTIV